MRERLFEIISWLIILTVVFTVKLLPIGIIEDDSFYVVIGSILSIIILSYYLVWKNYPRSQRLYIQNIAEVIIIGLLIYFARDLGIYFFSLFLLPIIATALTLEILPSILIVIIACSFIAIETLLRPSPDIWKFWQLILIILVTIFCRFLALEIKHQRELKEKAEVRALELEEMEKLSKEFVTLTSHQLFTPLSIIRGFVSLLKSGDLGKLNKKQRQSINHIYDNTLRMIRLVEELLVVSRVERGKMPLHKKENNLYSVILNIINILKPQATTKNLYIKMEKLDIPAKNLIVNIDEEKIEQALLNLLDNAIKYTNKGGIKIKLKMKNEKGKTEILTSITDTGVGIPKEYLDRLFQPFFRGQNILELDKKGTGLGLFIAKTFIEMHGGKIWAESNLDKGSTFCFTLPLIESKL